MNVKGQWYQMALKDHLGRDEGPDGLDAAILQNAFLCSLINNHLLMQRQPNRFEYDQHDLNDKYKNNHVHLAAKCPLL